nr:hypothetical protein [uncultured Cupriavidus sp.]
MVGAFDVIEHIDDDAGALVGMYDACKPGGGIVLTVPQHPWLWSQLDEAAKHKRRYTRASLLAVVREAGFHTVYVSSFMSLLLPAMVASRLTRHSRPTDGVDAGFRIGKIANAAFGTVCEVERHLLRAGMRLPVGGSLVLVAKKSG